MKVLTLNKNSLYLVKVKAIQQENESEDTCKLILSYEMQDNELIEIEKRTYYIPYSSSALSRENYDHWYEQTFFVSTKNFTNQLRIYTESNTQLVTTHSVISVKEEEVDILEKRVKRLKNLKRLFHNEIYFPFLQTEEALEYFDSRLNTKVQLPVIKAIEEQKVEHSEKLIAVLGDEPFFGMVSSQYNAIKINLDTLVLLENDAIDLILIQRRATQIMPNETTLLEESLFIERLTRALANSTKPILEISNAENDAYSKLIPVKNCSFQDSLWVLESELCNYTPLKGNQFSTRNVFIPLVSDLYQYPYFNELVPQLIEYGYSVSISETTYGHVPIRTWERFNSSSVKSFEKLDADEIVSIARSSGFIILVYESLRGKDDLCNLSALAIMSGCIPIIVGNALPDPFNELVKRVDSFNEINDFMSSLSTIEEHEHYWLRLFRQFSNIKRNSLFKEAVYSALVRTEQVRTKLNPFKSAEIICVTKRIDNLHIILDSFNRQSYPNLSMHLIWNVAPHEVDMARATIRKVSHPKIKISILDQSFNIGNCLNYGIRESKASYWFKFDDDDHYGKHYIEDMVNWYECSGADILGKPTAFVFFDETKDTYLRKNAKNLLRKELDPRFHFCGATLSGNLTSNNYMFSRYYRNSCDSKWVESVLKSGNSVLSTDYFNFSIFRGDKKAHTWQASDGILKNGASYIGNNKLEDWLNA